MKSLALCRFTFTISPYISRALFSLVLFLSVLNASAQQNSSISGTVKTVDNKPAQYVNIAVTGTTKGAIVGINGHYTIHGIKPGTYEVVASFVGLKTETQTIEVKPGETATLNFVLQENSKQLNQVVVKSNKHNKFSVLKSGDVSKIPLNDLENSQAYSTVTSQEMQEQGIYDLDDALRNVPGADRIWAATDRSGFGNGSSFVLRGFQLNTYLRNGLPANVSTTIDNANIESIEVLKGPSATLFGSAVTSYGGLINRVTKKPYDTVGGTIEYSGGSYAFNRLSADINAPLDSARKLLFRLNTALNTQNTWTDAGFHRDIFVAPSFTYKVNDRLSFNLDAEIYESAGTTPEMFFFNTTVAALGVTTADKLNVDYNRSYISNDLVMNSSNMNFTGQMNYKISSNWKSQTNFTVVNTTSNGPMPYMYLLPGNNQISRNVWTIDGNDKTLDLQENVTGIFNTGPIKHRLLAGLDYYNYDADVTYHEFMGTANGTVSPQADLFDIINSTGNIPNYLDFNKAKVDSAYANSAADPYPYIIHTKEYISAAYVSDVINFTDRLIGNAALRVDHFDFGGNYNPVNNTTTGGYNQTALSPKFGLIYQLVKNQVSLFGNYQNGFTNETGTDHTGKAFRPEEANQWEGGVKMNAFDGKLSGTVSYYDIHVKDILQADPNFPTFDIQNGDQLSKGVEVELAVNPFPGFNATAGYAYNDSKYTNMGSGLDGTRPNSSGPANMANFWLSYRILHGGAKGLGVGFGGNYAGKALVDNNDGMFYDPAYTIFNSSVFYDAGKFRLSVDVHNLTNKEYWIGWYTVNPQELRSIMGTIAFHF